MKLQRIKERAKDWKKENHEVAELLSKFGVSGEQDLLNALPLRMDELESFLRVIHASLEAGTYDERFHRVHIGRIMYLIEERFAVFQILVDELIRRQREINKKIPEITIDAVKRQTAKTRPAKEAEA